MSFVFFIWRLDSFQILDDAVEEVEEVDVEPVLDVLLLVAPVVLSVELLEPFAVLGAVGRTVPPLLLGAPLGRLFELEFA